MAEDKQAGSRRSRDGTVAGRVRDPAKAGRHADEVEYALGPARGNAGRDRREEGKFSRVRAGERGFPISADCSHPYRAVLYSQDTGERFPAYY